MISSVQSPQVVATISSHGLRRKEKEKPIPSMSAYANVVGGKLKLKGKPLDVRAAGIKKKKKKRDAQQEQLRLLTGLDEAKRLLEEEQADKHSPSEADAEAKGEGEGEVEGEEGRAVERPGAPYEDQRTAAEKKYHEQKAQLDAQRMSRVACKSHRQRVEEFNQYLANLSEHYDIPKVGPG